MKEVKERKRNVEHYIMVHEDSKKRAKLLAVMKGMTGKDYIRFLIDREYDMLKLHGAVE